MSDPKEPVRPWVGLVALYGGLVLGILMLERTTHELLGHPQPAAYRTLVRALNAYLALREQALGRWLPVTVLASAAPLIGLAVAKRLSGRLADWRARQAKMEFDQGRYDFPRRDTYLPDWIRANPQPHHQVFLGVTAGGEAHYLTDHVRETHVHILGQTGSGKTRSAIEPLLFQDLWRGRGVLLVDGKGAQENEERFAAMAVACQRREDLKVFTLNPQRACHTYNPLHLEPGADPSAVAERVFASFAADMDNPYYRDQARMFFLNLVRALAGTGKAFHMLDVAAAIASERVLRHALGQSKATAACREIGAQLDGLGHKVGETFTGLLAAVKRYDHPAINAYDPDIVLEREIDQRGAIAFFLPINYYKQLAGYVGLIVFQHLQQLGALRQLDRSRSQSPIGVYADEFAAFADMPFIDALNKLRDARISIHLAHQSLSDLERVSPEFAAGVWDNTRTKIVLLQTNPELCERLAKTLGTQKGVEMTVRRSADGFLNKRNMLEASTKEVDEYRLHPSRVKMLKTFQAYVTRDAEFVPVNLQVLPDLPKASPPAPKASSARGLGLHKLFVEGVLGTVLIILVGSATVAEARDQRTLSLRNVHTGEVLRVRPFGRLGRLDRVAEARIRRLLRSRRTGLSRVYPRTVRVAAQMQRHLGGGVLTVYSAYRGPGDPRSAHSYHSLGRAMDVEVAGVAPRETFEYCRSLAKTGCGLYPHRSFVHVDARQRNAVWVDLSTGDRSQYVAGTETWLRAHPDAGRRR